MATSTSSNYCVKCNKPNAILKCEGCLQGFCYNHVLEHRQELNKQLDQIEINRDLFRQSLNEQTKYPQNHLFIQQINQWESKSIDKIQQTANQARKLVLNQTNENINEIEKKLSHLTDRIKEGREENNFMENNLNEWKEQLLQLKEELDKPTNITIQQDSSTFISQISVIINSSRKSI